jgi:hypothetical protein
MFRVPRRVAAAAVARWVRMARLRQRCSAFLKLIAFLLVVTPVEAATVSSTDSFDPSSGLWTYNYTLDNTSGTAWVNEFYFSIVGPPQPPPGYYYTGGVTPPAYTAPNGWSLQGPYGASIYLAGVPGNFGSWGFNDPFDSNAIAPGQTGVFTLTSEYAPTNTGGVNDYFLYGCASFGPPFTMGCGVQGIGNINVPSNSDFAFAPIPPTPLPSALPMLLTGIVALGLFGWRRKRKGSPV